MDESWRIRMGVATKPRPKPKQTLPRRRSTEETSARAVFGVDSEALDPEDFTDVFGGPPRSVLSRQFSSGEFTRSQNQFYEEIFRPSEMAAPARNGRNLPEFTIPARRDKIEGFYSDIFGRGENDDVRWSRSRSKSNSSSVLSSEELSPLRPAFSGEDDVSFSSFASKLRPINVPCRWNSSTMMQQGMPDFPSTQSSHFYNQFPQSEYTESLRTSHFGFSRRVTSPETIYLEPNSCGSFKVSRDDLELNSPSSVVSSLYQDLPEANKACKIQEKGLREQEMEQDEDEVMSSYIIEINADHHREGTEEALGIDEAIAWAKEKFYTQSSNEIWSKHENEKAEGFPDGQMNGLIRQIQCPVGEEPNKWGATELNEQLENNSKQLEMEALDEDIRLWSAGKEANIRLLLSTLDQILWPNSGWYAIPLTNLVESSQVKKAYQKARLCLHPDKLQQRGATIIQKYIAEKAFSILQEAWTAYFSQDVFFS